MKAVIVFDSRTHTTEKAAGFIDESNNELEGVWIPMFYGASNGLPCITTANSYSGVTPEGDLYILSAIDIASSPLILTIPIPLLPGAVAIAAIVSLIFFTLF